MRKSLTLLAVASLVLGGLFAGAGSAQAKGVVKFDAQKGCVPILGFAPTDSTRLNGMPDATTHEHMFWGNPVPVGNNTVTYDDATAIGPNSCATQPDDRAGEWMPALCTDSTCTTKITASHPLVYYRCMGGINNGCPNTQEIPADARLISNHYNWTCGQHSGAGATPVQEIPDCAKYNVTNKPGDVLTFHNIFQDCWDGLLNDHTVPGDINDNNHFTWSVAKKCPAEFPIPVTQVKYAVQLPVPFGTDYSQLILSSDVQEGTVHGLSAHGDYSQWWLKSTKNPGHTVLLDFLQKCVIPAQQAAGCG